MLAQIVGSVLAFESSETTSAPSAWKALPTDFVPQNNSSTLIFTAAQNYDAAAQPKAQNHGVAC
jgi:hypothetical protein